MGESGAPFEHGGSDQAGEEREGSPCFVAGTKVHTIGGLKNIEEIQVGDLVLSKSDVTGEVTYKKVVNTFIRQTDAIYKVRYIDCTLIETTWNHSFRVIKENEGSEEFSINNSVWKEAKDLVQGDIVFTSNGTILKIQSIEITEKIEIVYNFEVEDNHTYFVGEDGVLVHNDANAYGGGSSGGGGASGGSLEHGYVNDENDKKLQAESLNPHSRDLILRKRIEIVFILSECGKFRKHAFQRGE